MEEREEHATLEALAQLDEVQAKRKEALEQEARSRHGGGAGEQGEGWQGVAGCASWNMNMAARAV